MTVEDGLILRQGEGREGKDPLQGLQGLLESHGAGKSHGAGGMLKGPWAAWRHLLSLLGKGSATKLLFLLFAREE